VLGLLRFGTGPQTAQEDPNTVQPSPQGRARCKEEEQPFTSADWGPGDHPLDPFLQSNVPTFNNGILPRGNIDGRAWLVSARDAVYQDSPEPDGGYQQSIDVNEQSSYRVRFLFWNNAYSRPGLEINGVRMLVKLPTCSSADVRLVGAVEGDNAVPSPVWSTVHFHANRPFRLEIAPDGGPGHRPVACWPSTKGCNPNGDGFVPYDPSQLVGTEGLPLPGGTLVGRAGVILLLYVRPVFD
jgi:hypothetical protein